MNCCGLSVMMDGWMDGITSAPKDTIKPQKDHLGPKVEGQSSRVTWVGRACGGFSVPKSHSTVVGNTSQYRWVFYVYLVV